MGGRAGQVIFKADKKGKAIKRRLIWVYTVCHLFSNFKTRTVR